MLLTRNSGRKGKHFLFDRQANAQKMYGMLGYRHCDVTRGLLIKRIMDNDVLLSIIQ